MAVDNEIKEPELDSCTVYWRSDYHDLFHIARACRARMRSLPALPRAEPQRPRLPALPGMIGLPPPELRPERLRITATTFSAFALESYLNEYGTLRLHGRLEGEALRNLIEKLNTQQKATLFPYIVTGRSMNVSENWYANLKRLIWLRNNLVHSKAELIDYNGPEDRRDRDLRELDPIKTVQDVLAEIRRVDASADVSWAFQNDPAWDQTW